MTSDKRLKAVGFAWSADVPLLDGSKEQVQPETCILTSFKCRLLICRKYLFSLSHPLELESWLM